ncbi:uncharacterized protein LAESUDRAFT_730386 [Laetiporus sulphureus 93-53]|uniref:DUF6533 domain-containing protein n=1 Tax=Laetiporus sulphureus 93-53 TaxID=1314785 RepID=A0A165C534_9APHY|nr:uncharacterized protein LAESUDRAFT_730386 [Laetiporus sulphureus 93-53]KZT02219.1 hypothetical protein LAESUDRAFT_730386 [Laetiporus sulphureus 93-53]
MSDASAASILAQEVDYLQDEHCTCSALTFYEYIVTFPQEVHVIWGARLTTVTVIFAINRYLLIVQGVSNALNVIWWHTPLLIDCRSCNAVTVLNEVTTVVLQAVTASFAAFRTYAISGHQVVPALLVLLLGLAQLGGYYIFGYAEMSYAFVTHVGSYPVCEWNRHESRAILNISFLPAVCLAVSDLIVVLVTWYKTFRLAIEVRKLRFKGSIATMLMRDGTLHFMYDQYPTSVASFLLPITSILVSRFILNLRQVSLGSVGLDTISNSTLDTPDLPSRLVGNFGAELQDTSLGFEDIEDDTEDEQNISEDCEAYELTQVQ